MFIVTFRELAHQFLEDVAHIHRTHFVDTQISLLRAELLDDQIEQVVLSHCLYLLLELHAVNHVDDILREMVQV